MEAIVLPNFVKTIFNDEKIRQEFVSNPNGVLSRFKLTEEEKTAILNIHAKLGLVTGDSSQLYELFDPFVIWV